MAVATVEKLLLVEIQLYYFKHQQTCYAGRPANFQSKLVLGYVLQCLVQCNHKLNHSIYRLIITPALPRIVDRVTALGYATRLCNCVVDTVSNMLSSI